MEIEAAMLANYAETYGPLLSVIGGGWEHCAVPNFPAEVPIHVAGVVAREPEDMGENRVIQLTLCTPEGEDLPVGTITFDTLHVGAAAGVPARTAFAFPFRMTVPGPDVYRVRLIYEDQEVASLPFEVQQK